MNSLFKNMLSYEIILAVMGMVIFIALVFLLIYNVMKKQSITTLLPFFLVPIIMVAYPTLKSIKVGDIILDIQEQAKIVEQNPKDTAAAQQLEKSIAQIKSNDRLLNNSNALVAVANAQMVLGNYSAATNFLNKAKQVDPETAGIVSVGNELNQRIEVRNNFVNKIDDLKNQISNLKRSPGDTLSLKKLNKTLAEINPPRYVQPDEAVVIAKSYAIAGEKQQSLQIINKLDSTQSASKNNIATLKDSIRDQSYQKQFVREENHALASPPKKEILSRSVIRSVHQ